MTAEDWRALLEYRDGFLYWRVRPNSRGRVNAGDRAGSPTAATRPWMIVYRGQLHRYDRVIWMVCNGDLTAEFSVEHIDGDLTNNHIENLRVVASTQRQLNRLKTSPRRLNTFKGVCRVMLHDRPVWAAMIRSNGKIHHLGWFDHEEEAAGAYAEAALAMRGELVAF